jgi:hypothetical protein
MKKAMNAPVSSNIAPTNSSAMVNPRRTSKKAFANNVTTTSATITAETTQSEIAVFK